MTFGCKQSTERSESMGESRLRLVRPGDFFFSCELLLFLFHA